MGGGAVWLPQLGNQETPNRGKGHPGTRRQVALYGIRGRADGKVVDSTSVVSCIFPPRVSPGDS